MRKFGILFAALAAIMAVMAIPGTASAARDGSSCSYVDGKGEVGVPQAYAGSGGTTDDSGTTVVGGCVDGGAAPFYGGTLECGVGTDADDNELLDGGPVGTDAYCVADGDNRNENPADGYVGVSSYETDKDESDRTLDGNCSGNGGSNGGGCVGFKNDDTNPNDDVECLTDDFDPDTPPCQEGEPQPDNPNYNGNEVETGVPTPMCGNDTGNQWEASSRDGCSIPD